MRTEPEEESEKRKAASDATDEGVRRRKRVCSLEDDGCNRPAGVSVERRGRIHGGDRRAQRELNAILRRWAKSRERG